MGFVDSFINYIKYIKRKLIAMARGEESLSREEEQALRNDIQDVFKKYKGSLQQKTKIFEEETSKFKEKIKETKDKFLLWESILVILVVFFSFLFVFKDVDWSYIKWWICGGVPFLLFFLGNIISISYGEPYKYQKTLFFIFFFLLIFLNVSLNNYTNVVSEGVNGITTGGITTEVDSEVSMYIFISVGAAILFYMFSKGFMGSFEVNPFYDYTSMDNYSFFKSNYVIEDTKDIIIKQISNILKQNLSYPYEEQRENENYFILDIEDYKLLFVTHIKKILSFIVIKRSGNHILIDEECKQIQEKIEYVFESIMQMQRIEKDFPTSKKVKKLQEKLIEEYMEPEVKVSIGEHADTIKTLIMVVAVLLGGVATFEFIEGVENLIAALGLVIGTGLFVRFGLRFIIKFLGYKIS